MRCQGSKIDVKDCSCMWTNESAYKSQSIEDHGHGAYIWYRINTSVHCLAHNIKKR
jgi:hypothetical protein